MKLRLILLFQAFLVALACVLFFFTLYQIATRPPLHLPDSMPDTRETYHA